MSPFYIGKQIWTFCAEIGNNKIWENRTVKISCVTIDNELKLNEHLGLV